MMESFVGVIATRGLPSLGKEIAIATQMELGKEREKIG